MVEIEKALTSLLEEKRRDEEVRTISNDPSKRTEEREDSLQEPDLILLEDLPSHLLLGTDMLPLRPVGLDEILAHPQFFRWQGDLDPDQSRQVSSSGQESCEVLSTSVKRERSQKG